MSVFSSETELRADVTGFLTDFLASDDAKKVIEQAESLTNELTLLVDIRDPDIQISVDLLHGEVSATPQAGAAASVRICSDDLHHLMMDQLGPVEISQLSETERLSVSGRPEALAALVLIAVQAQPYYPSSLRHRGRTEILDAPAPESYTVWGVDGPPPPLIETRRPWQRAKASK